MITNPKNTDAAPGSGRLTISEAARQANVNYNTIKAWIEKELLPATIQKHNSRPEIKASDLQRIIEECGRMPRRRGNRNALSPNEVAKMLGVTGEAVKQWIHRGLLRAIKLPNGYWQIGHQDLMRYLKFRQKLGTRELPRRII